MSAIFHTRRRRWTVASGTPGCSSKAARRRSPSPSRATTSTSVCPIPGSTARSSWNSARDGRARRRPSRGWGSAGRGALMKRRARLRPLLLSALVTLGLVAVCFARRDQPSAQIAPAATDGLQVLLTTSELIVGQNRLALDLLKDVRPLVDARSTLRLSASEDEDSRVWAATPCR